MIAVINDEVIAEQLIRQRQAWGVDKYDEVWDGVYFVSPNPNNEHAYLIFEIGLILKQNVDSEDRVYPSINVSDRADDWTKNYRCPDLLVYRKDNPAEDRDTYMLGGPDLAIEIVSRGDRSREKLDFYARVSTKELVIIDREPWCLELYRLDGGVLRLVASATQAGGETIQTQSVPLSWRLSAGEKRPALEIRSDKQTWSV